jgi:hypothetical protein
MTQLTIFESVEHIYKFSISIFPVEEYWHAKLIRGIGIKEMFDFYAIEESKEQAMKSIKKMLIRKGYHGKITFELPFKRHPFFFYKNLRVQTNDGVTWILDEKTENGWIATGIVNKEVITTTIKTRDMRLYNAQEGLKIIKSEA